MVTIHMEVVMTTTPQTETQINCITEQKKEENERRANKKKLAPVKRCWSFVKKIKKGAFWETRRGCIMNRYGVTVRGGA